MEFQAVILQKRDHVAKVSLNRPERLNAVNQQMFKELNLALTDVAEDSEIWVLVLTGEGRAFCASADMKEQRQGGDRLLSEKISLRHLELHSKSASAGNSEADADAEAHHRHGQWPGGGRRL